MRNLTFIMMILLITLLMIGCAESPTVELSFELDADGNYKGFQDLPESYTTEQAIQDGCYVRVDSKTVGGEEAWDDFLAQSAEGKDVGIRIVNYYDDTVYYSDLFYDDGFYRIFDSSSEDLQDDKYHHLIQSEDTLPNAARSGSVTILTDDETLTYLDVMWTFLSSDSRYSETISPFKLIMLN